MKKRIMVALSAALLALCFAVAGSAADAPGALRAHGLLCEYLQDPLGIDEMLPRLSWAVESDVRNQVQTAYRVLVSVSREALEAGKGDVWDSGVVASGETLHIVYFGKPLQSRTRYFWKVMVWDANGAPSPYSKSAWWEMGLLSSGDWQAKWIARTADVNALPAPLLRRAFRVSGRVARARAYVSGLGYYELSLNGKKVGDRLLDPGYTRYDKRVLYTAYDITAMLREGENVAGIMLGNGWYNVQTRTAWNFDKAPWRASPRVMAQLEITTADGRTELVTTDGQWKAADSPVIFNSIYEGETYDARKEQAGWNAPRFNDRKWRAALEVEAPKGVLKAQAMPPIRVTEEFLPVAVSRPKPGVVVYDMGQNFAGFARLAVYGTRGAAVTMRFGEALGKDGLLAQRPIAHFVTEPPYGSANQRFQTDVYILKGSGAETWEPRFTYHGFRYVEIFGSGNFSVEELRGLAVHTDAERIGEFRSSDDMLNRIFRATLWSYRSNLHGIPTDCPTREKNGWTGDAHLAAEQAMYNFFSPAVYEKWLGDLADEQRPTGELPGIVPTGGWGYEWGNGPAWDSAYVLIPWYLYLYHGDTRVLERHYTGMARYVDYLTTKAKDGIVSIGLGDWVPYRTETPVEVTSTLYYYADARIVSRAAEILGRADDARRYEALSRHIRDAFGKKFVHGPQGNVATGSQTALGCALDAGMIDAPHDEAVLANLLSSIAANGGRFDVGILGAKCLPAVLTAYGKAPEVYGAAVQKAMPSWGYWMEQGATTLWENWDDQKANELDVGSKNHIMFGDIAAWMMKALAGINADPASPAFGHVIVRPAVVEGLSFVHASFRSARGIVSSEWKTDGGRLTLRIVIPANTTATVYIPAAPRQRVFEGGVPAEDAPGVRFLRREGDGIAVFAIGSGTYEFVVE